MLVRVGHPIIMIEYSITMQCDTGVKRIMAEARELSRDPSTEYTAKPTEEDLFVRLCHYTTHGFRL